MREFLGRFASSLALLAVSACGGQAASSDGDEGAGCSSFDDDAGWSVAVSIANQTSRTIHLGQSMVTCRVEPLFHVNDGSGEPLLEFSSCRNSCEDAIDGDAQGCPALCAYPGAITLEPGEGTNTIWSGVYRVDLELPADCAPAETSPRTCDRAEQIEPGPFTFFSRAGTSLDCSQTIQTCGACEPNGVGGCTTGAALIAGSMLDAETSVTLDASYGVGGPSGGGPTLPVELVFTE